MENQNKIVLIKQILDNLEQGLGQVKKMLEDLGAEEAQIDWSSIQTKSFSMKSVDSGQIIEGVFNGQHMVGPDGREYDVPPNYASKSKLVEGDILKLTIRDDGGFIYKPIKPIERDRIRGDLVKDTETGEYRVLVDTKLYKVLLAPVTYFKGNIGDEVILLVPKGGNSKWAAVENIISKQTDESLDSESVEEVDDIEDTEEEVEVDDNDQEDMEEKIDNYIGEEQGAWITQ